MRRASRARSKPRTSASGSDTAAEKRRAVSRCRRGDRRLAVAAAYESLQHALLAWRSGRLAEARACCERLLSRGPDCAAAQHLLGAVLLDAGDNAGAAEQLQRAAQRLAGSAQLQSNLA